MHHFSQIRLTFTKILKNILKEDGILVLSGILDEKKSIVLNAVEHCGLKLVEEDHINQWTGLIVRR
ncbi:50S ribosomal protein L11 methyltransferase [bacterium]|nr:50S ribosomal protein L11 methyltransferase [bacterium]